jgi:serine/threonine-protein kinase
MSDDSPIIKHDGAIADGTGADSEAAATSDITHEQRQRVEDLRIVANLASVHLGAGEAATKVAQGQPASWGPLQIRGEIGQGHFGTVYLAWDPALERRVALKLLRQTGGAAEIIREGRLLARVRHPNVVTVYGVDEHDGVVGLWMEFVDGLTLSRVLATSGVLGPREAALIGLDLCGAVAAVHEAGLVHRDIKAQNLIREGNGRLVLMDFGTGEVRADRSLTGSVTGTPLYLAPEIFAGAPATIASDIYSIGVVLFHLVTGGYPVEGQTLEKVEAAHAQGDRRHLADARPDLPSAFVLVVERALQQDPAHRWRSSDEMRQELIAALQHPQLAGASAPRADQSTRLTAIAVLPFASVGSGHDLEYLGSGLADELLTGLAKVPGLRVASRTSASHVARIEQDARSICRALGVEAVLEGTVRKAGEQVRITAQLVSATDGCHLWSDAYDRSMTDVFTVQDHIARSIVDRLQGSPIETSRPPLIGRHTQNSRAYHSYLKGRFYWTRRYHGGLIAAHQHFTEAIQEDAGYALAYAGLADAYAFMGIYAVQRPRPAFAAALAAVTRALALDPDLPEAHTSLAFIRLAGDWDLPEAAREFLRALTLDPRQAVTRIYYSWLLVLQGDVPGALSQVHMAQDTDPLSPLVNAGAGHTLYLARRYADAIVECEKALEIDPNFILAVHVKGMCRALQGDLNEATELAERTVSMSGRAPFYLGVLGHYRARAGHHDTVRAIQEELERKAAERYVPPHCMTFIHAALNDLDRAFEWQAKAYDDGASPFN